MIVKKVIYLMLNFLKELVLIPVGLLRYFVCLMKFCKKNKENSMPIRAIVPIILDKYKTDGSIDRHYFLQDIYVARKIIEANPENHFDIGSRIEGLVSHLLSAYNGRLTVIDIRPLPIKIDNLNFVQADATNLEGVEDESIDSLSSLHAVEHFGLGRYGDPIAPNACFQAMKSFQKVIRGGHIVFQCADCT